MGKCLDFAGQAVAGVVLGLFALGCATIAGETIARGCKIIHKACKGGEA